MNSHFILTPYFLDTPEPGLTGLARPDWSVNDQTLEGETAQARMSVLHEGIAEQVELATNAGDLPISIAGDCCSAIGVLAGLQRAGVRPRVMWFDAHGDFNTWDTSPSGFLGGMPLAMIAGLGEQQMLQSVGLEPVPTERILLTDGRDLDEGESMLVADSALAHVQDVKQAAVFADADQPLYLHFDTDVINPVEAPAMRYTAAGGPSSDDLAEVFEQLAATGRIAAITVSTWSPELDADGSTQAVSMRLLDVLLRAGASK